MRILLLEPDAQGRISGGFVYNERLCAAAPEVQRCVWDGADVGESLPVRSLGADTLLLADSLFFKRETFSSLFALRASTGCRVGCLVHALPSFIERASLRVEAMGEAPWSPSDEEVLLLTELDVVVAPGPFVPTLMRDLGLSTPCVVALPGCERRAAPRRVLDTPARIITIAALAHHKGYLDAARALASLQHLDWRWSIVGDTQANEPYVRELRAALRLADIESRVTFLGPLRPDRIWGELERHSVLLHASYTENQPLSVMEALAAAVPVLGYRVGGLAELVEQKGAGELAPLFDQEALARALGRHLTSYDVYTQASAAAAATAREWPSWAESARALVAAIEYQNVASTPMLGNVTGPISSPWQKSG
jgi:glycosyltransferase involved in cell wall biosynthesis